MSEEKSKHTDICLCHDMCVMYSKAKDITAYMNQPGHEDFPKDYRNDVNMIETQLSFWCKGPHIHLPGAAKDFPTILQAVNFAMGYLMEQFNAPKALRDKRMYIWNSLGNWSEGTGWWRDNMKCQWLKEALILEQLKLDKMND